MRIAPNLRIFICGKTQSGKTHLAKSLIRKYKNWIIYDIKHEYEGFGAIVFSISELLKALSVGCNRIVFRPKYPNIEEFDSVCAIVYEKLRNILFVVDEVHKVAQKWKIPQNFNSIVTICEAKGIGVISISQRPANVHNDIISQSTIVIAFRMNLQTDAESVHVIPAEKIMSLPQHSFMVYDERDHTGTIKQHKPI